MGPLHFLLRFATAANGKQKENKKSNQQKCPCGHQNHKDDRNYDVETPNPFKRHPLSESSSNDSMELFQCMATVGDLICQIASEGINGGRSVARKWRAECSGLFSLPGSGFLKKLRKEMIEVAFTVWEALTQADLDGLNASRPRRLQAVMDTNQEDPIVPQSYPSVYESQLPNIIEPAL
jgi:hypothetical protein